MTLQHNQLSRYTELLRAYTAALGERDSEIAGLERAGETLTPVIDLWSRPEWAWLRGEDLWCRALTQSKVAAEFGFVAVINPSDSRNIVVLESANIRTGDAAGSVTAGVTTEAVIVAIQDAAIKVGLRDRRDPRVSLSGRTLLARGGGVAIIGASAQYLDAFTTPNSFTQVNPLRCLPLILQPGFAWFVEQGVFNLDVQLIVAGWERPALPGELG